jgi:hypothetical protein
MTPNPAGNTTRECYSIACLERNQSKCVLISSVQGRRGAGNRDQGTGIREQGTGWDLGAPFLMHVSVTYPHPHFENNLIGFIDLRIGIRCKIVITIELFSKSCGTTSYGYFLKVNRAIRSTIRDGYGPEIGRRLLRVCRFESSYCYCAPKEGNRMQT